MCESVVDTPYVIINADDYYGKEAFVKLHDFLVDNAEMGKDLTWAWLVHFKDNFSEKDM